MSIPPQYARRLGNDQVNVDGVFSAEDCRDYLRTGRCKYGASCKYNHPLNVQSGGGMKGPIDPSEPLFPIRPNEPICQYYMKHGTCKFGQACKFHHPPQTPFQAVINNGSGAVMMNVGEIAHQIVLNPVGNDLSGNSTTMMIQFLPQRPEEPDCIYYLKNGRCKYGTTCRYHHPVNLHKRRVDDRRVIATSTPSRMTNQDHYRMQKVQYVTTAPALPPYSTHGGPETPVSLMHFDGTAVAQGFQPIPIIANNDGTTSYGFSVAPTELASSASSLASSYDTTGSALDNWSRSRRNGSGGSLNAFAGATGNDVNNQIRLQPRSSAVSLIQNSASDCSIASRSTRGLSLGSGSEGMYYEAVHSIPRNQSTGSWRTDRSSSSLEHSRAMHATQYQTKPDGNAINIAGGITRSPQIGRAPSSQVATSSQRTNSRTGQRGSDEGFTRMTSALLNMLDTPEEMLSYDDEESRLSHASYPLASDHVEQVDPALFARLSLKSTDSKSVTSPSRLDIRKAPPLVSSSSWSSSLPRTYKGIGSRPSEDPASKMEVRSSNESSNEDMYTPSVQHQHHVLDQNGHSSSTSAGSDFGLYLP